MYEHLETRISVDGSPQARIFVWGVCHRQAAGSALYVGGQAAVQASGWNYVRRC